jgi:hypothetical protein
MNTRNVMLPRDFADPGVISLDVIAKVMPSTLIACGRHLRSRDGAANVAPSGNTLGVLFRAYLQYLRQFQFRYTLSSGRIFWDTATVGSPEGNCQTVASNFLYLLWAYGFSITDLGIHIVEIEHPTNEKIVNKKRSEVVYADVSYDDMYLLGGSRGTRSFKVNRQTRALEPLRPARNPFLFHAISYVASGGYYKYYDARNGCKYKNGATDFFEGYRKGDDLEYVKGSGRAGYISLSSLTRMSTQAFIDPTNAQRQIYLLPPEYDADPVVAGAVGDYAEGGNWVFVDEADWEGQQPPARGTRAPDHVRSMFEA